MDTIKDFKELVRKFGEYKIRGNNEVGFDCPKCGPGRKKFHLGVNTKKKVFHCFKCHFSGGYGGPEQKAEKPAFIERAVTARLKRFTRVSDSDKRIVRYLKQRGVGLKRARKLFWGKCPDGKLLGRLVIPIKEDGEIVYYVARSVEKVGPKEISPPKDKGWLPRNEVVYGLDDVKKGEDVIIVEGLFDAEHLKKLGRTAVALLGSSLSDVQLGKILAKRPRQLYLMFDGDEGGIKGQESAYIKCTRRFRGNTLRVVLPEGTDPDELTNEQLNELIGG